MLYLLFFMFWYYYWLLYMILLGISSNLFTCLYSNYNLYISIISHNNYYPLSFFMVITVIIVSSIILYNSLSYLSIIDSYLFLLYIILFQFSMINFILSDDIITTYFYWDLLGIISYVLVNYWSSKINCGIKAIIYNKIGDSFFLLLLGLFYSILSFISYNPELSYSILLPAATILFIIPYSTIDLFTVLLVTSLLFIFYSKSAQLPFSTWLLNAISAPTPISALLHSILFSCIDFSFKSTSYYFITIHYAIWSSN